MLLPGAPTASAPPRHAVLRELIEAFLPPGELAHDGAHIDRVYRWAIRLAPEAGASADLAGAAALVHDLVPIPKDHPDRALGGERSARAAGPVLSAAGYDDVEAACIIEAVRTSSWSRGFQPTSPEGAVLQDADRLDAIGAIGVARCFATAQHMSRPGDAGHFYAPGDPFAATGRPLDDRRYAIDHFGKKLLRLAGGMHTRAAQEEAARRHGAMTDFLAALDLDLR
jgi:uncharacterized protein